MLKFVFPFRRNHASSAGRFSTTHQNTYVLREGQLGILPPGRDEDWHRKSLRSSIWIVA